MESKNLYIEEQFVNLTEGYRFGDSGVYESCFTERGEVYRYGLREYGKCVGKCYIDTDTDTKAIGWVFQKLDKYTDTNEPYLRETWITIHEKMPVTKTQYFYA